MLKYYQWFCTLVVSSYLAAIAVVVTLEATGMSSPTTEEEAAIIVLATILIGVVGGTIYLAVRPKQKKISPQVQRESDQAIAAYRVPVPTDIRVDESWTKNKGVREKAQELVDMWTAQLEVTGFGLTTKEISIMVDPDDFPHESMALATRAFRRATSWAITADGHMYVHVRFKWSPPKSQVLAKVDP